MREGWFVVAGEQVEAKVPSSSSSDPPPFFFPFLTLSHLHPVTYFYETILFPHHSSFLFILHLILTFTFLSLSLTSLPLLASHSFLFPLLSFFLISSPLILSHFLSSHSFPFPLLTFGRLDACKNKRTSIREAESDEISSRSY